MALTEFAIASTDFPVFSMKISVAIEVYFLPIDFQWKSMNFQ